jgi:hypothetical protein
MSACDGGGGGKEATGGVGGWWLEGAGTGAWGARHGVLRCSACVLRPAPAARCKIQDARRRPVGLRAAGSRWGVGARIPVHHIPGYLPGLRLPPTSYHGRSLTSCAIIQAKKAAILARFKGNNTRRSLFFSACVGMILDTSKQHFRSKKIAPRSWWWGQSS